MAKIVAAHASELAARYGMEIMGGYGFAMEYPMQRHFRDHRQMMFSPISDEMAKNYIAESFGLPRSFRGARRDLHDALMGGRVRFESRIALVTGAGSGIGKAIAVALAGRGPDFVVNDMAGESVRATAAELEAAPLPSQPRRQRAPFATRGSNLRAACFAFRLVRCSSASSATSLHHSQATFPPSISIRASIARPHSSISAIIAIAPGASCRTTNSSGSRRLPPTNAPRPPPSGTTRLRFRTESAPVSSSSTTAAA